MKARVVATALLLAASVLTVARQQRVTAPELYAQARLAFDQGYLANAIALARDGQRRFGQEPKWNELFGTVVVEGVARSKVGDANKELDRLPHSGDPEASIRRLMAHGYANRDTAEADYKNADALAATVMPSLRAEIAVRRSAPCFNSGNSACTRQFASEARSLLSPSTQPFVLANAYGMWAAADMQDGDYQQSIEKYIRGMRFSEVAGATGTVSKMLLNYGWSYLQLGDADEARRAFQRSARIAAMQHDAWVESTSVGNLSAIAIAQGHSNEALSLGRKAVEITKAWGVQYQTAMALTNLARAQLEVGDAESARRTNDEALALFPSADSQNRPYALLNAARIDAMTGARDKAMVTLVSLERTKDDLPLRWTVQAEMARIYSSEGDHVNGERMYEAALDTGDQAFVQQAESIGYLFAFEANLFRTNDDYITFLLNKNRPLDALRVAERSRARTLFRGRARPPFSPVELARIHDATILFYWLAPKRSLLWIVSSDGVSAVQLPPLVAIEGQINAYRDEIMSRAVTVDGKRGASLFRVLVPPAALRGGEKRFIVIPDGRLNTIGLESLVVDAPSPHYWIEDATVSFAPALALIPRTTRHRPFREARALLIGDVPSQGSDYPALPFAGSEIEHVASYFGDGCQPITGERATRKAYLTADLTRISHMHFATHATANMRTPLASSVILHKGPLSAAEIADHPLPTTELVTISSCSSAGRRSYAGEGPVGLAWAFLRAGARRVVASQWDVSDVATADVMDGMYRELAADRTPAEALREAKLKLIASGEKRPYYWAPFILYGAP